MTINASYTIIDSANSLGSLRDVVMTNVSAAFQAWAKVLAGNADIQVTVTVSNQGSSNLASAGPRNQADNGIVSGLRQYESNLAHQLRTGRDTNGVSTDLNITINSQALSKFYFDPNPLDDFAGVPSTQYDFFSTMMHEVAHCLGFFSYRDDYTGAYYTYKSIYDDKITYSGGAAYFTGENVSRYNGGALLLATNDLSHTSNAQTLMSPYATRGQRDAITAIDLAVLADLGIGTKQSDILKVHTENTGRSVFLDAGAGVDTVVFSGLRAEYKVQYSAASAGYVVTGKGFTDTIRSAELIRFNDTTVWIEDAANMTSGVHRFYNADTGTHFYTGSNTETYAARTSGANLVEEGFAFASAAATAANSLEVFRFQNQQTGAYFYTIDTVERDNILKNLPQFNYQGSSFRAYTTDKGPQEELYRFFNTTTQSHFYTTSETERDTVQAYFYGFKYEGVAFYVDILT
jgi:hypothetical protein